MAAAPGLGVIYQSVGHLAFNPDGSISEGGPHDDIDGNYGALCSYLAGPRIASQKRTVIGADPTRLRARRSGTEAHVTTTPAGPRRSHQGRTPTANTELSAVTRQHRSLVSGPS